VNALETAALGYAARGLAVLPLRPGGKAPAGILVPHGLKDATTDPARIAAWWKAEPDANVAIRTGQGIVVLDVDPRAGGDETIDAYLENLGERLPVTAEVATGGEGWHHWFQVGRELSCARLGPGLDLKADGGYVVAPPSIHPSGKQYAWHPSRTLGDVPLAPVPEWVARTNGAAGHHGGRPANEWTALAGHGVSEGARNTEAASYAGRLLGRGLGVLETFYLLEAWNAVRNRPPLPADELEGVVESIARKENRKHRRAAA